MSKPASLDEARTKLLVAIKAITEVPKGELQAFNLEVALYGYEDALIKLVSHTFKLYLEEK